MSKFTFGINVFTPIEGQPHRYEVMTLEAEAETVEAAYRLIEARIPAGHKMWYWYENKENQDELPAPGSES